MHVVEHGRVLAGAGGAALVEQPEDAVRPLRDEVERVLVVLVLDKVPLDLLANVRLLLELENVLDEQVVQ